MDGLYMWQTAVENVLTAVRFVLGLFLYLMNAFGPVKEILLSLTVILILVVRLMPGKSVGSDTVRRLPESKGLSTRVKFGED